MADAAMAQKMVEQTALVSRKIREALQASLPVAPEQLMTVQIPGTIIDTSSTGPYVWDDSEESDTPHRIKVNESRLVDNMVPLSKVMMGITGKSVARSYAAALDMLIPEDAPIDIDKSTTSKTAAAERYIGAMKYVTSSTPGSSRSVIDIYVEKQQAYAAAMDKWEAAKAKTRAEAKERFPHTVRDQQRYYDDWNQESFRGFKDNAQAKYMDWVVNGNKYKVDYYFGIVDVSSAMKRVESSKEAFRNLVVIDPDGSTEWQQVHLTPANWASICRDKVVQWQTQNKGLSRKDYEFELKRLKRLLLSYTGLKSSVDPDGKIQLSINAIARTQTEETSKTPGALTNGANGQAVDSQAATTQPQSDAATAQQGSDTSTATQEEQKYTAAAKNLYDAQHTIPLKLENIRTMQLAFQKSSEELSEANLKKNKATVQSLATGSKAEKVRWLNLMIADTKSQINLLQQGLDSLYKANAGAEQAITDVDLKAVTQPGGAKNELMTTQYAEANDQYARPEFRIPRNGVVLPGNPEPSKWTKISISVSATSKETSQETFSSTTSASVSGGNWWSTAAASANHSQASLKASQAASECAVEIKFEALLVTIDRSWLHGELFSDPELNTNPDVALSPGALSLHKYINQKDQKALDSYPYFPSYPTAFVVAANVELEFRGETAALEEAIESSHTDAQVRVGWGPFALSASHSQDKSSAKTKMETTASGTRITLEAPAIIGWLSQLVPQLPRPKGRNFLAGPLV